MSDPRDFGKKFGIGDRLNQALDGQGVKVQKWIGPAPSHCQMCGMKFGDRDDFVDGKLERWGIWCTECFDNYGGKYGTGRGQMFNWKTRNKLHG